MKVIKYTLDIDGTIPKNIIDGGYFPVPSELESPQDYYLVGIAESYSREPEFLTEQELIDYLNQSEVSWIDADGNDRDLDAEVSELFSRIEI